MTFRQADRVTLMATAPPVDVGTPWYLRGKTGWIERDLGQTHDPEALAYGRTDGPRRRLYRVLFEMKVICGVHAEGAGDCLDAEIFDHWLEDADAP